ncbi:MAG TPA: hypothetical protein DDZ96_06820 [Porphyromonadaceae bacterium]|jgi:hypothetical protein|nr:hypothetical protein [Porphyromonadaceae bacterium]HBL33517.1 hypothetical protein [Porphyromonadaceae bacterium]HBX19605.1 hypothetical protein [Porphyromonadaceae bacterium]HCM19337.1 hypothetical protein [Porphyromonadaceae bacterium]
MGLFSSFAVIFFVLVILILSVRFDPLLNDYFPAPVYSGPVLDYFSGFSTLPSIRHVLRVYLFNLIGWIIMKSLVPTYQIIKEM